MKLTNKQLREIIKETISELDENPCWDGYEAYGTKMKDGREVPNCVPVSEANVVRALKEGDTEYEAYFRKELKKTGKSSPADMTDDEKRAFFAKVDAGWTGKTESVNAYDEWKNTRIQAKNIFRMLKQKYNNNISKMKDGLELILKQNKTKDDQAEVVRDEFNKFFKIKTESVSESATKAEISNILKNAKADSKRAGYDNYVYLDKSGDVSFARKAAFERFDDKKDLKVLYKVDGNSVTKIESVHEGLSSDVAKHIGSIYKGFIKVEGDGTMIYDSPANAARAAKYLNSKKIAASSDGKYLYIESINEGNAFGMAVTKAKEEGKTQFEFNGKTYNVKNSKKESKLGGWGSEVTSGQKVTQEGGWGTQVETKKSK